MNNGHNGYPKYQGNYLGIIIQNNDPLKRGRVKVFVPHISPTVYSKWVETAKDKKFKFLGRNVYSDLTDILDDLKKILPWAEVCVPLAGEAASGRFNAFHNIGTISDSSDVSQTYSSPDNVEIDPGKINEYSQNPDNIGEKPGFIYDVAYYKLKDAFADPSEYGANNVNVYTYNYTPECYSNCAKGSFPILRVGAHVWVFFHNGDPLKPVVFGSSYGADDWKGIFDIPSTENPELSAGYDEGLDYPGSYENAPLSGGSINYDINIDTYRNKYVINQKGGTIAFVNTDNRETLKLTHFSGSFKEFNNNATIELATANDQKLVLGDSFLTIRGTRNEFTEFDYDCIIRGDHYVKIGKNITGLLKQWRDKVKDIATAKAEFDTDRSSRGGTPDKCPVCNKNTNQYFTVNTSYKDNFQNKTNPSTVNSKGDFAFGKTILPRVGSEKSVKHVGNLGHPINVTPVDSLGGSVDGSTGRNGAGMIFGSKCPACGGSGQSSSSQGGKWNKNQRKAMLPNLKQKIICELKDIEKKMGIGGSHIVDVAKHKVENIGTVMNNYPSVRVDPKGKNYISEVKVGKFGTYYNRAPTPLVEPVQVESMPGGNYTINAANNFNVQSGAGGSTMKSSGPVNISGSMANMAGTQVNISSENEVNVDGGKRISIIGDVVSIKQRDKKQVVVESSLGITNNVTVAGGLHVEGEGTFNHITMPAQIQATEQTQLFGAAATDQNNGNGRIMGFGVPLTNYPSQATDPNGGLYFSPDIPGAPAFIGITDMSLTIGRLPTQKPNGGGPNIIGYIPKGVLTTINPQWGWIAGNVDPTGKPIPTPTTIEVPILAGVVPSFPTVTEAGGAIDAYAVYGTGEPNIRGAFSKNGGSTDAGIVNSLSINNATAQQMPLALYGTGRQADSIMMEPHSHLFRAPAMTLTDTNAQVRSKIIDKYAPINAEVPVNAPQTYQNSATNPISPVSNRGSKPAAGVITNTAVP